MPDDKTTKLCTTVIIEAQTTTSGPTQEGNTLLNYACQVTFVNPQEGGDDMTIIYGDDEGTLSLREVLARTNEDITNYLLTPSVWREDYLSETGDLMHGLRDIEFEIARKQRLIDEALRLNAYLSQRIKTHESEANAVRVKIASMRRDAEAGVTP